MNCSGKADICKVRAIADIPASWSWVEVENNPCPLACDIGVLDVGGLQFVTGRKSQFQFGISLLQGIMPKRERALEPPTPFTNIAPPAASAACRYTIADETK